MFYYKKRGRDVGEAVLEKHLLNGTGSDQKRASVLM